VLGDDYKDDYYGDGAAPSSKAAAGFHGGDSSVISATSEMSSSTAASLYSRDFNAENPNIMGGYKKATKDPKVQYSEVMGTSEVYLHPSRDQVPVVLVNGKAVPASEAAAAEAAAIKGRKGLGESKKAKAKKMKALEEEAAATQENPILTISTSELPQLLLTRPPPMMR
jgi:hypothetical protein